jgi:hypothetical protein
MTKALATKYADYANVKDVEDRVHRLAQQTHDGQAS